MEKSMLSLGLGFDLQIFPSDLYSGASETESLVFWISSLIEGGFSVCVNGKKVQLISVEEEYEDLFEKTIRKRMSEMNIEDSLGYLAALSILHGEKRIEDGEEVDVIFLVDPQGKEDKVFVEIPQETDEPSWKEFESFV